MASMCSAPRPQCMFRRCPTGTRRGKPETLMEWKRTALSSRKTVKCHGSATTAEFAAELAEAEPQSALVPDAAATHNVWRTFRSTCDYDALDMLEIGAVWKALGIRGEVAIRMRTSLQDMRVGLSGRRYFLPWHSHRLSDPSDPLNTQPMLYQVHQRLARQKLHSDKTVWLAQLEGVTDRQSAGQLPHARVFMHRHDCPDVDSSSGTPPSALPHASATELVEQAGVQDFRTDDLSMAHGVAVPREARAELVQDQAPCMTSTVPRCVLRAVMAEEIRGFEAHLAAPIAQACGGVRIPDAADGAADDRAAADGVAAGGGGRGIAAELERAGGSVCIGRVVDVHRDERRFYDTGQHVRARGATDLPGACPTLRVAFRNGLVLAPAGGFAIVGALPREELLLAEGAEELREHGRLSNGATPVWIPNSRSGLLPLLPLHVLHIDFEAERVVIAAGTAWLRDHLAPRMVKKRPPRRTDKAKASMGDKYRKRRDKAFIRRKGKFARKGRNMRKT
eukprot:jgi/Ulvmu1/2467/UM136_0019.1